MTSNNKTNMNEKIDDDLKFKGNDPGAVRFGNFMNYYSFHPPNERISRLPDNVLKKENKMSHCLDIGCNTGDLTKAFSSYLSECGIENQFLGIDIDPILIERAKEKSTTNINYSTADIMSTNGHEMIQNYLKKLNLTKFHIVSCFSITMWIHLNHGDIGLTTFLERVSNLAEILVIEAQPWKCYRNAVKRMKKTGAEFPYFKSLKYRENVTKDIENILIKRCNKNKIMETEDTKWGRKTLFFR